MLIDEWQRLPEVRDLVRRAVDDGRHQLKGYVDRVVDRDIPRDAGVANRDALTPRVGAR